MDPWKAAGYRLVVQDAPKDNTLYAYLFGAIAEAVSNPDFSREDLISFVIGVECGLLELIYT